jgi:integrase
MIRRGEGVFLPTSATTQSGIEFEPRAEVWVLPELQGTHRLRFRDLSGADPELLPSIKATLLWYAQHRSGGHTRNLFATFLHFVATISRLERRQLRLIADVSLMNYRADHHANEKRLSALSGALKKWHALGYPGVDESAIRYLNDTRIRGNRKGVAVATMDPWVGPLTDLELESVLDALTNAFAAGRVPLDDYVAVLLLILIAPRPIQLASMKIRDLLVSTADDGTRGYIVRVPRAKTRLATARAQMKERPIPAQVGELLERHVGETRAAFRGRLTDPMDAPMFPGRWAVRVARPGFTWHQPATALSARVKYTMSRIAPVSERIGGRTPLTPTRFRRTLGTRARGEGHGLEVIAELLDHSDLQNVAVYAGLTPTLYERIDKKTAFALAPLIRAFQGTPVSTLNAEHRRITDPRLDTSMRRPVGCCGSAVTCDFAAPVACYTCRSFRAWLDGPHESMLARLLAEHEHVREACDDETVAASLVRSICAVAEVVTLCRREWAKRREVEPND